MNKYSSYVLGVYHAGVDAGVLYPTSMDKMAQQAEVAAATMDEVGTVGSSVTPQDISSLAKILSVLTQLQQMYGDQMAMPPEGMPPEGMPPEGMPPQEMQQAPMGPPPQGMQAPGPGPAMQ